MACLGGGAIAGALTLALAARGKPPMMLPVAAPSRTSVLMSCGFLGL